MTKHFGASTHGVPSPHVVPGQVSILMPAFNAERYVGDAIRSCLGQTLDEWQLIIINDCSTDRTLEIIAQFNDPRITTISLESNSGPGAARNAALFHATGEWITTLDADDAFEPVRLQALREIGKREGSNAVLLDELRDWEIEAVYSMGPLTVDAETLSKRELSLAEWIDSGRSGKPFFHRELLIDEGVRYPDEVRGTEDLVFMCRLALRSQARIVRVGLPTYIYRRTPGSLVSQRQAHIPQVNHAIKLIRQEAVDSSTLVSLDALETWINREDDFLRFKSLIQQGRYGTALRMCGKSKSLRRMIPCRLCESIAARARIKLRKLRQKHLRKTQRRLP